MTDTEQTFDERWNAYWEERRAAEKAGDKEKLEALVPTFFALSDEQTRERDRAISEALDHVIDWRGQPVQLDGLEREAITSEVDSVLHTLDEERGLISEALKLEIAASYTSRLAGGERLKLKLLVAFLLEHAVSDIPPEDGLVGKALDEVIPLLLAYARASGNLNLLTSLAGPAS